VSGEVLRLSPRGADWRMDVIDLVDEHRMRRKKQPRGGAEKKKRTKIYLIRVKEEPHVHTSPNSLYMIGLAWLIPSLAAGVAMRYVLPVSMDDVIFSHNGPRDTCDASSVYLSMTQQGAARASHCCVYSK